MHFLFQLLLAVLASLLLVLIQKKIRRNVRKPAQPLGPLGLPIIGNLHQCFTSCLHLHFHELSKKYGPLVSLRLGFVPTLVVSSAKMAKEVMKTHDHIFSSRPKFVNQQKLSYNGLGIALAPFGDYWRGVRNICAIHLLSSKKVQSFSSVREEEVHRMIQKISGLSDDNMLVNLSETIMHLSNTVICRIAFGRRNDADNATSYRSGFQGLLMEVQELVVGFCFADYFPYMGWVGKLTGSSVKLHKVFMKLDALLEEIINEHVNAIRPKSGVEDTVDALLRIQQENSFGFDITRNHIKAILLDLFAAGTDTSAASVVLAMTELMKNLEAMKRVQEEARSSTGNKIKDMIKEEDLEKLVYLKAVVKEIMRLHPVQSY